MKAAHIVGEKPSAARYDVSMTEYQRNQCDNLVYLCGDHHTQIDKQKSDFPTNKLLEMKGNHENKVRQAIASAFADVGFPELEEATRWIMENPPHESDQDFSLIPSEDKLRKNDLGNGARNVITMGLSVVKDVGT